MKTIQDNEILVVGGNGQLGNALRKLIPGAEFVDKDEFDMTDDAEYAKKNWNAYKAILNVAAYTAVDAAETPEGRRLAWQINADAVAKLVRAANSVGAIFVHISSDYVFDGEQIEHTEDEPFTPLGVYAQTKAAGDIVTTLADKYFLLRTSWVIGEGKNFVRTMAELAKKGATPTVVSDQTGRLTFTEDLAGAMIFLLENKAPFGTYNFSNDGDVVSWAEVAQSVFELSGAQASAVTPITTEEYFRGKPEAAPRPRHSALDLTKIKKLGLAPSDWRAALKKYMEVER